MLSKCWCIFLWLSCVLPERYGYRWSIQTKTRHGARGWWSRAECSLVSRFTAAQANRQSSVWIVVYLKCFLFSEPYSINSPSNLLHASIVGLITAVFPFKVASYLLFPENIFKERVAREKIHCECCDIMIFAILVIMCVVYQITTALTFLPSLVIYDYRFISNIGMQLMGFFGCMAMACALGMMFPIVTPLESWEHIHVNQSIKDS